MRTRTASAITRPQPFSIARSAKLRAVPLARNARPVQRHALMTKADAAPNGIFRAPLMARLAQDGSRHGDTPRRMHLCPGWLTAMRPPPIEPKALARAPRFLPCARPAFLDDAGLWRPAHLAGNARPQTLLRFCTDAAFASNPEHVREGGEARQPRTRAGERASEKDRETEHESRGAKEQESKRDRTSPGDRQWPKGQPRRSQQRPGYRRSSTGSEAVGGRDGKGGGK